ncbi:MAG TPA: protein kinase [Polyangiaceae bacterium]|nr:protein kinase [Polyangiaceae bacterium]
MSASRNLLDAGAAQRVASGDACLGDDVVLAFAEGMLDSRTLSCVDRHLDGCAKCQELVAAVLHSDFPNRASGARRKNFEPGSIVAGRYRIVRFLGCGGMGEVYEAEDRMLGERVALKSLAPALADSERAIAYLKSEVQLARRVSHPNVCRVFDLGVHGTDTPGHEVHFLTMQLCPGDTLGQRVRRGPLPMDRVTRITEQLLQGLAAAHDAGILHRDFKSDNVILGEAEEDEPPLVTITDFGLARAFAEGQPHVTTSHLLVGSAAYMAPEQVEGGPLTEAVDIYGFGVVLFEMLTGSLPFLADTPMAMAVQRLRRPPPRPSERVSSVPAAWDEFVLRCLAREPSKRFDSARAALRALPHLQVGRPRMRLRPLLVGLGVVLASVGGVVLLRSSAPSASPAVQQKQPAPQPKPAKHGLEPARPSVRPELAIAPAPARPEQAALRKASETKNVAAPVRSAARRQPSTRPSAAPRPSAPRSLDEFIDPFE